MRNSIFNKTVFPLLDLCNRTRISKYLNFLRESQWWSRAELENYQHQKLQALIQNTYQNSPYFRNCLNERGLKPADIQTSADLKKLPVINKEIIKKNYATLLNQQLTANDFIVSHSGGTTSSETEFYLTRDQHSWRWASRYRMWEWAGYTVGDRYLNVACHPPDTMMKKLYSFFFNRDYAPFSDEEFCNDGEIPLKFIRNIAKIMGERQYDFMVSYNWAAFLTARYIQRHNIKIFSPRGIITHAETLLEPNRKYIEEIFQCPVFDYYGMGGEGVHVAAECEQRQGYHICMEDVIVEFLNGDEPAAEGELANVVITALNNYALPLIRYNTGDVASWTARQCACGRELPLINSICGRNLNIVTAPDGTLFTAHFFSRLLADFPGIEDYQIIQSVPERLKIVIERNQNYTETDSEKIFQTVKTKMPQIPDIRLELTERIPVAISGKKQFVYSDVPFRNNRGCFEKCNI